MGDLFLMILILVVVIGGCLGVIWFSKEMIKKRALTNALQMPEETKRLLKQQPFRAMEVTREQRIRHCICSAIIGLVVYLIILAGGIFRTNDNGESLDKSAFTFVAIFFFVVILFFVIKDILKVAPWKEIYRIKAISSLTVHGSQHAEYICYYDFIKCEFVADALPDTTSLRKVQKSPEGIFDVLVIAGNRRLRVIDVAK